MPERLDWPTARAVGDTAVLFEFGDRIDVAVHEAVLAFDAALAADPPPGLVETVPAYAALLIVYDPLSTDPGAVEAAARARLAGAGSTAPKAAEHRVPVCFDPDLGPDLAAAADRLGISEAALVAGFIDAEYRVYMYGFAPGYAYLGGVPAALHLPRKTVPVRRRPVGSVMIAGGQALITTLPMPTGWWVIGATGLAVLRPQAAQPFRFAPGDTVRFEAVRRADCPVVP